MRYTIMIITAWLLGGCAPWGHAYTVYVDPAFTSQQQELILADIDDWSAKTGAQLTPTIGACGGVHDGEICMHALIDASGSLQSGERDGSCITERFGMNAKNGGELWIDLTAIASENPPPAWLFDAIVKHEMGHAMGLVHTGPGTVMYGANQDGMAHDITPADVAQWDSLR